MTSPTSQVRTLPSRNEVILLGVIGLAFTALCIALLSIGSPLGHDEAVYATRARDFANGQQAIGYWAGYRASGLPWILQWMWAIPHSDAYLRLVVTAFGGLAILFTWLTARQLVGPGPALIAAAGLALTPTFVSASTQVWPDIPGAAFGVAAIWVFVAASSGDRLSWFGLLVAPLAFAATTVRLGAPIPLAIGLGVITLARWSALRKTPIRLALIAAATGGAGAVALFTPAITGTSRSAWAALSARNATLSTGLFDGFADLARSADTLVGTGTGLIVLVGIVVGVSKARRQPQEAQGYWITLAIGLGTGLAIILAIKQGEARYLAPAWPFIWMAAGVGLSAIVMGLNRGVRIAVGVAVLVSLLTSAAFVGRAQLVFDRRFVDLRSASQAIDEEVRDDEDCLVITSYTPQVAWYSGCTTRGFQLDPPPDALGALSSGPDYLMLVLSGKRQPTGEALARYMTFTEEFAFSVGEVADGFLRYVEVHRLDDD